MYKYNILNKFSKFWIIFFPIASYFFYRYVGFNEQLCKAIYFVVLPITVLFVFSELIGKYKNKLYAGLVRNIFMLMCFSMLMAYSFWGQGFDLSYRVTAVYLAIVFFFFLMKTKPDLIYLEKIIWFFGILYLMIWIYGLFKAPELVFGLDLKNGIDDSRGVFRLEVSGRAFLIVCFFMSLNKYTESKKSIWIGIFILLFIAIVMQVIRQIIAFSFLIGLYHLLKSNKYLWIWMGLAGIIIIFSINNITIKDKSVIGKLIALSEDQFIQQKHGDEDIRTTEYRYFFTKYSKNIVTDLFGNGVPHTESPYGEKETRLQNLKDLYSSDVGYADIFMRFGLLGLFFYGLIFFRVIKQKVPQKYMYAKLFILYLIFANVAASWVFQDTIVICICLYILESCHENRQETFLFQYKRNEIFHRNTRIQSNLS